VDLLRSEFSSLTPQHELGTLVENSMVLSKQRVHVR